MTIIEVTLLRKFAPPDFREGAIFVQNLFCGLIGVQNLFCCLLFVPNLFCEIGVQNLFCEGQD